jgi:hypothetical protein
MRRALAVMLGTAIVAAAAVNGSSASQSSSDLKYWVDVQLTGTGQGVRTFGTNVITETYSFSEYYFAEVESRSGIVNYLSPPSDLIEGSGYANYSGGLKPCSATFAPEYFKAGGSEGIRTWFGRQRPDIGDPGPNNSLVTAMTDFGFVVGTPASCAGTVQLFGAPEVPELHCVVTPAKGCTDSWASGDRTNGCQGAGSNCDHGSVQAKLVAKPTPDPDPVRLVFQHEPFIFYLPPIPPLWAWSPSLPLPPWLIPTKKTPPKDDGELDGQTWIAKQPLVTVKGRLKKGVTPRLALRWSPAGVAAARRITKPTLLTTKLTFSSATGKPTTITTTSYLMPRPKGFGSTGSASGGGSSTPKVTSVVFGGTATNPRFVVHGTNLGAKPKPSPASHPSGQGGCPVIAGDNGYDYGTSLYVASSRGWSGGRYRPTSSETDCIDLVVTKFTSTEVDFHFGPFYSKFSSQFPLMPGDQLQVVVNGATKTVTR